MSTRAAAEAILENLQAALAAAEKLQKDYDKLVDDTIIIAAELGAAANYDAVISRIRSLRAVENNVTSGLASVPAKDIATLTSELLTIEPAAEREARESLGRLAPEDVSEHELASAKAEAERMRLLEAKVALRESYAAQLAREEAEGVAPNDLTLPDAFLVQP